MSQPATAQPTEAVKREAEKLFEKVNDVIRRQMGDSYAILPFFHYTDAITAALASAQAGKCPRCDYPGTVLGSALIDLNTGEIVDEPAPAQEVKKAGDQ